MLLLMLNEFKLMKITRFCSETVEMNNVYYQRWKIKSLARITCHTFVFGYHYLTTPDLSLISLRKNTSSNQEL